MRYQEIRNRLGTQRFSNIMHISRKYHYIYVANPKAACSTLKLILSKVETNDPDFTVTNVHNRKQLPLLPPGKLSMEERSSLFEGTFFRFSFVRHPFKRVISAYIDKILGNKKQKEEILGALGKPDEKRNYPVSFDDFVTVISEQDPATLNPHWRPQHLNLATDLIDYDFIGHLENFETDLASLRKQLELPDFGIPHRNRKSHLAPENLSASSETHMKLETLYAQDLQEFSYSGDIKL